MRKHFVTFFSPGTFFAERTEKPIERWDVNAAKTMADNITERYGATPYGFQFTTRERKKDELDSKVVATSAMYYLGGTVLTFDDVVKRNDSKDKTLIANMKGNGWNRIIQNNNSYCWIQPLENDDVVLEYTPPKRKERKI